MNASNFDQPFTRPVAFRRNKVGASPTAAIRTPSEYERLCRGDRVPRMLTRLGHHLRSAAPDRSAVHQLVVLDLLLLGVDVDDRSLKNTFLVCAPWVQYERRADPGCALALVDVPVKPKQRLDPLDRRPDRGRPHRTQRPTTPQKIQVLVERGRLVDPNAIRRRVEVEDRAGGIRHLL